MKFQRIRVDSALEEPWVEIERPLGFDDAFTALPTQQGGRLHEAEDEWPDSYELGRRAILDATEVAVRDGAEENMPEALVVVPSDDDTSEIEPAWLPLIRRTRT